DDRLTPALVGALQRLSHGVYIADALEAVIRTTFGNVNDGFHHIVHFFGIDEVRHAELPGERNLGRIDIDADNLRCTHQASALDHIQTDAAKAEHHHPRTRLYLRVKNDGANARGNAAA